MHTVLPRVISIKKTERKYNVFKIDGFLKYTGRIQKKRVKMDTFDCGDLVWREDVRRIILESLNDISTCHTCNKEIISMVIDSIPSAESHDIFTQIDLIDDLSNVAKN